VLRRAKKIYFERPPNMNFRCAKIHVWRAFKKIKFLPGAKHIFKTAAFPAPRGLFLSPYMKSKIGKLIFRPAKQAGFFLYLFQKSDQICGVERIKFLLEGCCWAYVQR
jgi:hypothetical protein